MKTTALKSLRVTALVLVWAGMSYAAIIHQQYGERPGGAPTIHALCPFGGLASLYKVVAEGSFIKRIHPSAIVLLVGTVLLALVFRRAFCGWICPLGAMQELFATIGRKLRWRMPLHTNALDGGTRWLKYLVLVVILALTYVTGTLVFAPYDPWAAYAHVFAGLAELRGEFLVGGLVLVASLVGSMFVDRPWCRYLCPLGAFLGVVSRLGGARVVRNPQTCVHCMKCERVCPVDIRVEAMPQVVTGECLACGECVAACPVSSALQFRARRTVVSPVALGSGALLMFFSLVLVAHLAGVWRSLPTSMTELVEYGGELSPDNIRGFMTIDDIAGSYGIPADELIAELGLPEDVDRGKPVKDVMKPLGRDVEEVREVLQSKLSAEAGAGPSPGRRETPASEDQSLAPEE